MRIKIKSFDRSQAPGVVTRISGFFSVKAAKGVREPKYFPAGSSEAIVHYLGPPSASNPGVKEVLDFNSEFGTWVSAPEGPTENAFYGGAYFTTYGWIPFYQVTDPRNPNLIGFREYPINSTQVVSTLEFARVIVSEPWFRTSAINNVGVVGSLWQAIRVYRSDNNTTTNLLVTNEASVLSNVTSLWGVTNAIAGIQTIIAGNEVLVGYVTEQGTGSFAFYFIVTPPQSNEWAVVAQVSNSVVQIRRNLEDIALFYLSQRSPTSFKSVFSVVGTPAVLTSQFNQGLVTLRMREEFIPGTTWMQDGPYTISLDPLRKDGFNVSLYLDNVIREDNPFAYCGKLNDFPTDANVLSRMVNIYASSLDIEVSGTRPIDTMTPEQVATQIAQGFMTADRKAFEEVKLFVDYTSDLGVNAALASLRNGRHRFATFVQPINRSATSIADLKASRSNYAMNEGFAYVVNDMLVRDSYSGQRFYSPLVGHYARKLARIMRDYYGGWAPMWYDTNGLGGVLEAPVIKAKFEFSETDLEDFDNLATNPIVLDPKVGPMVTSQRTGKAPAELSDYSWLGHAMALDMIKDEIIRNVMIPQIGKPNEPFWQNLRAQQVQDILAPRLQLKILADAKVEVASLNTDAVKAQRKFIIGVAVKVTPFSEFIELQFVNVGQASVVEVM